MTRWSFSTGYQFQILGVNIIFPGPRSGHKYDQHLHAFYLLQNVGSVQQQHEPSLWTFDNELKGVDVASEISQISFTSSLYHPLSHTNPTPPITFYMPSIKNTVGEQVLLKCPRIACDYPPCVDHEHGFSVILKTNPVRV